MVFPWDFRTQEKWIDFLIVALFQLVELFGLLTKVIGLTKRVPTLPKKGGLEFFPPILNFWVWDPQKFCGFG